MKELKNLYKDLINETKIEKLKELDSAVLDTFEYNIENHYFEMSKEYKPENVEFFFASFLNIIYENINKINPKEKKKLLNIIENTIIAANHIYRHGSTIISDELYDGQEDVTKLNPNSGKQHFYNLLKNLDSNNKMFKEHLLEHPLVDKDGNMVNKQEYHPLGGKGNTLSKTSVIGDMRKEFENLKNTEKIINVSEKLDGSSLYLTYDNQGRLIKAVTRGDGIKGEDVTVNAKKVPTILNNINIEGLNLKSTDRIQIRGEVIFMKDKFEIVNKKREEENKPLYANPRNSTAGIMSELSGQGCPDLDFKMFELLKIENVKTEEENVVRYNFKNKKEFLDKNDFLVPNSWEIKTFEEFLEIYYKYENGTTRSDLNYQIDGLVVVGQGEFGVNDNKTASYGYATKFSPTVAKAKIIDVEYNIEKAGIISSVLNLEPIDIDGTKVSRLSFTNKYSTGIKELLNTIAKNDEIYIAKMGDIIPKMQWNAKFDDLLNETYKELNEIITKEKLVGDNRLNIEYLQKLLEYVEKITVLKPNPENKDINLKYKQKISELATKTKGNNKIDLKNLVKEILNDVSKDWISELQKEINGLKAGDKKKRLQEDLKSLKISLKETINILLKEKLKIENNELVFNNEIDENLEFQYINTCPSCGSNLSTLEPGVKTVMCNNPNCEGVILSTLEKYAQTIGGKGIDIGRKTIEFLRGKGLLDSFIDFYSIKREDFFDEDGNYYEGWKEQSINNLLDNIDKLRVSKDTIFFKALNIREFSESTSTKLFQHITLEELLEVDYTNELEVEGLKNRLLKVDGFGDLMISYLTEYMSRETENIKELLKIVKLKERTKVLSEDELKAEEVTMVLTGSINAGSIEGKNGLIEWKDRKTLKSSLDKQILKNGIKVKISGSVSGKTDYIISDDVAVEKLVTANKEGNDALAMEIVNSSSSKTKDFVNKYGQDSKNIITTSEFVNRFSTNELVSSQEVEKKEEIDQEMSNSNEM